MSEARWSKSGDQPINPDDGADSDREPDLTPFLGVWKNTSAGTQGFVEFTLCRNANGYRFETKGADNPEPWASVEAIPLSANVEGGAAVAFQARCDLGFADVTIAANHNKGLIIIACYTVFKDDSKRSNYFTREFFYHADNAPPK